MNDTIDNMADNADPQLKCETRAESATSNEMPSRAAEAAADLFRDLITNLNALQETSEKAHSSFLAYMDRIILLSGGTLTLTFTSIATLSTHIKGANHSAKDIQFVVIACWLLVITIILGLLYISVTIKLRHQEGLQATMLSVDAGMKLKLLSLPWISSISDVSALPPLLDPKHLEKKVKHLHRTMRVSGSLSQITLVIAFIFLTLFIQSNIVYMLSK